MPRPTGKSITMTEENFREYSEEGAGYCISCRDITADSGTEPDAREYQCEVCDLHTLYGLEEALMMGFIKFREDDES